MKLVIFINSLKDTHQYNNYRYGFISIDQWGFDAMLDVSIQLLMKKNPSIGI